MKGDKALDNKKGRRITGCRFTTSNKEEQGNVAQERQQTEGEEMEK